MHTRGEFEFGAPPAIERARHARDGPLRRVTHKFHRFRLGRVDQQHDAQRITIRYIDGRGVRLHRYRRGID